MPSISTTTAVSSSKNIITSSGVFLKSPEKENSADGEKIRTYIFFSPLSESEETSVQKAATALQEEINKGRQIDFSMHDLGALLEDRPSLIRNGNKLSLGEPTQKQRDQRQEQINLQQDQRIVQHDQQIKELEQGSLNIKKDHQQIAQGIQEVRQDHQQIAQGIQEVRQGIQEVRQGIQENQKLILKLVKRPSFFEDLKNLFISIGSVLKFTVQCIFCNRFFKFLYHWFSNFFRACPQSELIF